MDNQPNQNSLGKIFNRKVLLIVFGVVILAEIIWAGYTFWKKPQPVTQGAPEVQKPTQIELQTDSQQVKVGQSFTVYVNISSSKHTDGVDLIISYNPRLMLVEKLQSGVPVDLGTIYNEYPLNLIDETMGKITVSGIATASDGVIPNGLFGSISFQALSTGQAAITLDFAPGSTVDTNVIEKGTGKDILENVKNLNVTIIE